MTDPSPRFATAFLSTRASVQEVVRELARPVCDRRSVGGARVNLGSTAAHYPCVAGEMEGFARLLWGVVPLAAGGGYFGDWERVRLGLMNGTDPHHPEFWGWPAHRDQRLVEMAPIALALCLVPHLVWEPLDSRTRQRLAAYLGVINQRRVSDSNWLFFRVLVNLALRSIDAGGDDLALNGDLDRLESFYLGDGWYSDGPTEQRDYYVGFALHYYGLIYSVLAAAHDEPRARRFRERAALFAHQFVHWFGADGAAVPFGRSLTYRFAQSAFWSATAFAGLEVLSRGIVKGLWLRNLRWWLRQPIYDDVGRLTIGYRYANTNIAEWYNAAGSPYWALKAFLPLALPAHDPFWTSSEEPLPTLPEVVAQPHARSIICRDRASDHVVALCGGQWAAWEPRHVADKYAKFCYSNRFGFSINSAIGSLYGGAFDNTLALSDDGEFFRTRRVAKVIELSSRAVVADWSPWPDVRVRTWLIPAGEWHVRVHRIRSARALHTAEGAFAIDCTGDETASDAHQVTQQAGLAAVTYPSGRSEVIDLFGARDGRVLRAPPNTNVMYPRTVIPMLLGHYESGEAWLACAVLGHPSGSRVAPPPVSMHYEAGGFALVDNEGAEVYRNEATE